jgi:hypothetical protein
VMDRPTMCHLNLLLFALVDIRRGVWIP